MTVSQGAAGGRLLVAWVLVCSLWLPLAAAGVANISNSDPRVDANTGAILDMHDGNTMRINDTFFWYGAGYGPCREMSTGCASSAVGSCGFNLNHTINLATSTDLVHWTFHGAVLSPADRPSGILFSPWVARSAATGMYVLWGNVLPVSGGHGDFDASRYIVAEAASPYGPFRTVVANVTGISYNRLPDAASIFVDTDGQGYLAFTHEDTHINHVQQLTPDLRGPLLPARVSAQIGPGNNEGALMFRRGNSYYVGFGECCCFCAGGTNLVLYRADSPLGPYGDPVQVATAADWGAQSGAVWFTGQDYVVFGDRWQSAPDHIKAHDFSYMAPLAWSSNGSALPLPGWQDWVQIAY